MNQLAKEIGFTPASITQLEKGVNNNPSLKLLKNLADYFKVSIDWLVYGKEDIVNREEYEKLDEFERKFIREYVEYCISRKGKE
jgi:transcriptional regulator with XRE-family HTH domain